MRWHMRPIGGTSALVVLIGVVLVSGVGTHAAVGTTTCTIAPANAPPRAGTDPAFWRVVDTGYVDPGFWHVVDTGYVDPGFAPGIDTPAGGVCSVANVEVPVATPTDPPAGFIAPARP